MSRAFRDLEVKSGRGLIGRGRSRPEPSSMLASAARGYFGMRASHLNKVATRRAGRADHIDATVGKLERMKRTHPKKVNRTFATYALIGSGGARAKQRQATRSYNSAARSLRNVQRGLRHFGG